MKTLLAAVLSFALLGAPAYAQTAQTTAQTTSTDAQLQALQAQLDALKAQIEAIKAQQLQQVQQAKAPPPPSAPQYVRLKPGNSATFLVGKKDEVTLYGHLDLSFDDATKGLSSFYPFNGSSPVGNRGWMTDISTNISYFGVRGFHTLGDHSRFVYQLETQIDVSSTSGITETSSNESDQVKGGLTSRNSFIGIQGDRWGAIKIGKTDAPYKNSTGRMNPFSGEWGDYGVIMGNTGGDNRVEFGTRVDHAIWYESPNWSGIHINALVSPGQNRSYDDSDIAAGESDCAGGNIPGSGALPPFCNDGSFGSLYSYDISYGKGPFYFTGAYELHKRVNRTSDLPNLDPNDVADEDAWKVGGQYAFSKVTTFSAIYEDMHRYVPAYLQYQNERTRTGFWFALTQWLDKSSNINFGWARANPTPGDPGQHNTPTTANPDNMANMFTVAYKHQIDRQVGWYVDYADTANHSAAHYDLGAGGRGITTDCHDASILAAFDATVTPPVSGNGPHCYAGGHLQGASVGLTFNF